MARRECFPAPPDLYFLTDMALRFAEMEKTAKNKISHRGIALAKLQEWFKDQPQSD